MRCVAAQKNKVSKFERKACNKARCPIISPGRLNPELLKDLRVKQWENNHFLECMNVTIKSTHAVKSHLR